MKNTIISSLVLIILFLTHSLANAQTAEEFFDRGFNKANERDYEGAIEAYNKVIEINPDDSIAYCNRGTLKVLLGDLKGAFCIQRR